MSLWQIKYLLEIAKLTIPTPAEIGALELLQTFLKQPLCLED
jgi:hypothetical protein